MELDEEFLKPIFNIGKSLSYKGDFENSIEYLDKYIVLESKDAEAYGYKGVSLFYIKEYEKSKRAFEKAYELDNENEWYKNSCDMVKEILDS